MMPFLKKILGLSLLLTANQIYATEPLLITNYNDLLTALTTGHQVKGILALHQCTTNDKPISNEMYGSLNFNNFNAYEMQEGNAKKKLIATSTSMLIETRDHGPALNYLRLRVFSDNSAELYSEYLNPQTYSKLSEKSYQCKLSDKVTHGGVTLYDIS
jgi:hypothetical protein